MTYHIWPQVLFAAFMLGVVVRNIFMHGQPLNNPTYNAYTSSWTTLWIALVLGCGGFWEVH